MLKMKPISSWWDNAGSLQFYITIEDNKYDSQKEKVFIADISKSGGRL
jgi:hypothetical protein